MFAKGRMRAMGHMFDIPDVQGKGSQFPQKKGIFPHLIFLINF